ncbi:hypothetical protein Pcinc_010324 [Petrolisthes cinctipes]|uniref:Dynein axonemal assembly factor 1 homolog n=1 Tax=Petrolisthes cinctipes TaxID=88211 RepID=A0AAE1G5L6_PETCI|nr:hypothetical protein Pcinc_010324 [Petrolisthes cinctipes]
MSFNWTASLKQENSRDTSDDTDLDERNETEGEKQRLHTAMKLCTESSGLMATVSTLRTTLQTAKRNDGGEGRRDSNGVGVSRGREWNNMEPLSLQVLEEALREQHPHLPTLTHTNAAHTCSHVTSLSLQFKGLGSLELVWLLTRLTKLELSNNSLTAITGIEKLTCLTWLDLSFNQIRRVTGVGSLRSLEVLALHNNHLEKLDKGALQPLARLQVFTLAHNNLSAISDVWTLRQLKSLASLSLTNNPLCDDRYPHYVLAHLPHLAYLDHRRITPATHTQAVQTYREEVSVVEEEEAKAREEEEREGERRRSREEHRRAGVLALDDGSLFDRMFRGDKDMGVLLHLSGAHTLMVKYRDQFNSVCGRVFTSGLEHAEQRQTELRLLHQALHHARTQADVHARGVVEQLEQDVEVVVAAGRKLKEAEDASLGDDQEAHEARVTEAMKLQEKVDGLLTNTSHLLLTAEITLADQIKDVVGRAKEELGGLVGVFLEGAAGEFEELRRLAYTFYTRLRELATKVVEEGSAGGGAGEDARMARVFEGGDTLTAALAGIHDRHLALVYAREADLRQHLHTWLTETLQEIAKEEWARHRSRVEEITTLTARQRQLLYDALPSLTQ